MNPISWKSDDLSKLEVKQNLARLILSRIEIQEAGSSKTWDSDVQVEHIAPQTWNKSWSDKSKGGGFRDADEMKLYTQYLGNRTLLDPETNNSLNNKSLIDKQKDTKYGYDKQATNWAITKDLTSVI